jgi:uncharacterized protein (DUF1684 family)
MQAARWIGLGVVLLGLFLVGRFLSLTPPDALMKFESVATMRAEKDAYMRADPRSPFNYEKHPVPFTPLKYFELSQAWVFRSALTVFDEPEAVVIFDTKGRERNGHVFGVLSFSKENAEHRVRVYRMPFDEGFYYGLWFTDRTTGEATYEVGRYLNFEFSEDPDHVYTIDFNQAYNPYCAYSPAYGCAIPRKEDFIDLAITAGEMRWHD